MTKQECPLKHFFGLGRAGLKSELLHIGSGFDLSPQSKVNSRFQFTQQGNSDDLAGIIVIIAAAGKGKHTVVDENVIEGSLLKDGLSSIFYTGQRDNQIPM